MKIDKNELNYGGEGVFAVVLLLASGALLMLWWFGVLSNACLGGATLLGSAGLLLGLWRIARILWTAKRRTGNGN
jgi:hypothetical protein